MKCQMDYRNEGGLHCTNDMTSLCHGCGKQLCSDCAMQPMYTKGVFMPPSNKWWCIDCSNKNDKAKEKAK